ncbi:MAG: hypothetical protein GF346_06765 [Candidatus Eisenbacteria bacterium]|nr:hypothetical protein [Candidatus Latescibacterota bacterium]MBD3302130.1 hypothetical protein [Candidatus Eisenbacteria bacterium]
MVEEEFGSDRFLHFEYHIAHEFATSETVARANWYGISGAPTVRIDGKDQVTGASDCDQTSAAYRALIQDRLDETGGITPVEIEGEFLPLETEISASAIFRLVDPADLAPHRATILFYEDDVVWDGRHWQEVVRKIHDETVTLENVGDEVLVETTVPVDPSWNVRNIHAVAYLQETTDSKQIHQGALLPFADFDLQPETEIVSLLEGSDEAIYTGQIINQGGEPGLFEVDLAEFPGDWPTEFFLCGSGPFVGPTQLEIEAGETCNYEVHVATDAERDLRAGRFEVRSLDTGRSMSHEFRLFNGGASLLLVDDDASNDDEIAIVDALTANETLFDSWDVFHDHYQSSPDLDVLSGYDAVIWQTGFDLASVILDRFDRATLRHYVEAGGKLFFTSQNHLNGVEGEDPFTNESLGAAAWSLEEGYTALDGVGGDPIGDGLHIELDFNIPFYNQGDGLVPADGAEECLVSPEGAIAMIRNEVGDEGRAVFMPAAFHAIDADAPGADGPALLIQRVLDWLLAADPTAVAEAGSGLRIRPALSIAPTPVVGRASIRLDLTPAMAEGPVRLDLLDPAGRRVRTLWAGTLDPGQTEIEWVPRSAGRPALESGIYFLRLQTVQGVTAAKAPLIR